MGTFKFGKKSAREGAVKLKFGDYVDVPNLPIPPKVLGKLSGILSWGMLANDKYSDCVWAGAAHEHILWGSDAKENVLPRFSDDTVLSDYSAATGFHIGDSSTDQGTDMQAAASYRQKIGIVDTIGNRHKIDSYISISPGNLDELALAVYFTSAVGLGLQMPSSALDQFDAGKPWDLKEGSSSEGGHYVPCVGRNRLGNFLVVTWGKLQAVTPQFIARYMDEGIVYISGEFMRDGVTRRGFDLATLQSDVNMISVNSTRNISGGTTMAAPAGVKIDPDEIAAGIIAARAVTSKMTYMGVNVGAHVTDDEYKQLVTAIVAAVENYRQGTSI